jgi:hypothetical protein
MGLGAPILNGHGRAEAAIVISGVLQGGKSPIAKLARQVPETTQSISEKLACVPLAKKCEEVKRNRLGSNFGQSQKPSKRI